MSLGRRAGRKRKAGARHPSGELKRVAAPDDRIKTSRQPHRRKVPAECRLDQRAESPLGRLYLNGAIDAEALTAGERYVAVVGAYRAVIESPRATAGSGRGFVCAVEWFGESKACDEDPEACACRQRRERYQRAYEALSATGRRAVLAVNRLAVHREELAREDLVYLTLGLAALARHFGLTGTGRRPHSRNAN